MANEVVERDDFDFDISIVFQGVIMAILVVGVISTLPVVQSAGRYFQSQSYEGLTDPKTLQATPTVQHIEPATPWISAYFINDGPNDAYIAINKPSNLSKILVGEAFNMDFAGASRRIEVLYYKTDAGYTKIRVTGQY